MIGFKKILINLYLYVFLIFVFSCTPIQYLNDLESLIHNTPLPYSPTIEPTAEPTTEPTQTPQIKDAFSIIQGEDFDDASPGVDCLSFCTSHLGNIDNGTYAMFTNLDFGTGAAAFEINITSDKFGGDIELRLDEAAGTVIGTINVPDTGGYCNYQLETDTISGTSGIHDLYFLFSGFGTNLFDIDWFMFLETAPTETPSPTLTPSPTPFPTPTPTPVPNIYDDSLLDAWEDWNWECTIDLLCDYPVYNGSDAVSVLYNTGYAGFYLHSDNIEIDMGAFTHVRLFIHGGNDGGQVLKVWIRDSLHEQVGTHVFLQDYVDGGSVSAHEWQEVDIPLADMNITDELITDFIIQNDIGETYDPSPFYLDMIGFY